LGGRLVEFDHQARASVPGVGASWKLKTDVRTLEVTLRPDSKFSDGHELTAEDVGVTLRAVYDERTASPVFRDALLIGGRQIEFSAIDHHHLRLIFPESVAAPESYLSNLAVLPRH